MFVRSPEKTAHLAPEDLKTGIDLFKSSIGIYVGFSGEGGEEDDPQIEKEGPIVDIVQVVFNAMLHLLERVGLATTSVDLSPARNARLYVVTAGK
jgi:hypothetical protein